MYLAFGHQTVGVSHWIEVGKGGAIGASAALDVTQHLGIVANEPGQVANVCRTVDRVWINHETDKRRINTGTY